MFRCFLQKRNVLIAIMLAVLLVASFAVHKTMAADNDNHSVTVTVDAINEIEVTGTPTLTINTAAAGSDPDADLDSSSTLVWTTNQTSKKITVETNLVSPDFTLKVLAISVTGGNATTEVTLITTGANDFVTGVDKTIGGCTIQYTASATATDGTGSDVHIVTYTIVSEA